VTVNLSSTKPKPFNEQPISEKPSKPLKLVASQRLCSQLHAMELLGKALRLLDTNSPGIAEKVLNSETPQTCRMHLSTSSTSPRKLSIEFTWSESESFSYSEKPEIVAATIQIGK
jgi:hypothetical protein